MNPGIFGFPSPRRVDAGAGLTGGGDLSADRTLSVIIPFGQCRLDLSGADLRLSRHNGKWLFINGQFEEIPAAGVALAPPAGLMPATVSRARTSNVGTIKFAAPHNLSVGQVINTVGFGGTGYNAEAVTVASVPDSTTITYPNAGANEAETADTAGFVEAACYIAAHMVGAVMTLEAFPLSVGTGIDATYGHRIKAGDPSRTIVGMAMVCAGPVWVDSEARRLVLSYFNRRAIPARATLSSTSSTSSTTFVDLGPSAHVQFLTWGDEAVSEQFVTHANGTVNSLTIHTVPAIDGQITDSGCTMVYGGQSIPVSGGFFTTLNEGYHMCSIQGATGGGGQANWGGSTVSIGRRLVNFMTIRG